MYALLKKKNFLTIGSEVRSIFCSFRAISHSAGCHPALSHTAQDFIPRYLTQRRMSSRAISHNAGCHPALSHTSQDFIPRCRTQRRICFDLFSKLCPCDSFFIHFSHFYHVYYVFFCFDCYNNCLCLPQLISKLLNQFCFMKCLLK